MEEKWHLSKLLCYRDEGKGLEKFSGLLAKLRWSGYCSTWIMDFCKYLWCYFIISNSDKIKLRNYFTNILKIIRTWDFDFETKIRVVTLSFSKRDLEIVCFSHYEGSLLSLLHHAMSLFCTYTYWFCARED